MIRWILAGMSMALLFESAVAAETLPDGMRACTAEKDDAKRLACFDREAARLRPSTPPAIPAPTPATTQAAEDNFGRAGGAVALEESKRNESSTPKMAALTATVVAISTRPHGEIVMTLDNGQVWSQTTFDSHFSVDVNDKVTIKAGALNSYRASIASGRSTSVTRLR